MVKVVKGRATSKSVICAWDGALYITLRLKRGYTAAPPHLSLAEVHAEQALSRRTSNTTAIKVP